MLYAARIKADIEFLNFLSNKSLI